MELTLKLQFSSEAQK